MMIEKFIDFYTHSSKQIHQLTNTVKCYDFPYVYMAMWPKQMSHLTYVRTYIHLYMTVVLDGWRWGSGKRKIATSQQYFYGPSRCGFRKYRI